MMNDDNDILAQTITDYLAVNNNETKSTSITMEQRKSVSIEDNEAEKRVIVTKEEDEINLDSKEKLLAICMELMRKWLSWRKWYRVNGIAYQRPIDRPIEAKWLILNGYTSILEHPIGTDIYMLDTVIPNRYLQNFADWQMLNVDMIRTALLQHYEDYSNATVEDKFIVRFLLNLQHVLPTIDTMKDSLEESSTGSRKVPMLVRDLIDQYRRTYFRQTYTLDHSVRCIDDSTLWYYYQCVYVSELVVIKRLPGFTTHGLQYEIFGHLYEIVEENGRWTCRYLTDSSNRSSNTNEPSSVSLLPLPQKNIISEQKMWLKYLRLAMLLNAPNLRKPSTIATVNDDIQLAFKLVQETKNVTAHSSFMDSTCLMNRFVNLLQLSMIRMNDHFVWYLSWNSVPDDNKINNNKFHDRSFANTSTDRLRRFANYVRFAPTANAMQLAARKYLKERNADFSGLLLNSVFRRLPASSSRDNDNERKNDGSTYDRQLPITVYVTNVMLDANSLPNDRRRTSFFLLHENFPKIVSVFVRPDQNPSVVHVLDMFNESECEAGTYLRWIVGVLDEDRPNPDHMTHDCVTLLRDIKRTALQSAIFVVDSFMCMYNEQQRYEPNKPANGDDDDTARQQSDDDKTRTTYDSERVVSVVSPTIVRGTTDVVNYKRKSGRETKILYNLCATMQPGKYLLRGKPKTNLYMPNDIGRTLPLDIDTVGIVPWNVNRADTMNWKCFTNQITDHLRTVKTNSIQFLLQQSGSTCYTLDNQREIERFIEAARCYGMPRSLPVVRLLSQPPFKIYKIVSKRVFTLADGTIFVTSVPLKFVEPLERGSLRTARYLDNSETCPLRWQRVGCFDKADIQGSEIWFPRKIDRRIERRCYRSVPRQIIPLIVWLDGKID